MTFDINVAREIIAERREKAAESFAMSGSIFEAGHIASAAVWGAAGEYATKTADLLEAAITAIGERDEARDNLGRTMAFGEKMEARQTELEEALREIHHRGDDLPRWVYEITESLLSPEASGGSVSRPLCSWQPLDGEPIPNGVVDLWVADLVAGGGRRVPNCHWVSEGPNGGWFDDEGYPVEDRSSFEATHWMRAPAGPG